MRIILLGHNKWACLTLRALLENGHEVAAVVAETDAYDQREASVYERFSEFGAYESLKDAADHLGITVHQPQDVNDRAFIDTLQAARPDLLICVSYHAIFRRAFLEAFPERLINAHLAPLPHYRGRAPINWAIINGEDHTAVTVHFIDAGIDTGPILVQRRVPIHENDRAIDVLLRALPVFPAAVLDAVEQLAQGTSNPVRQDPADGSYFPRRTPEDGLVDWASERALDIHRKIRALADPYPCAYAYWGHRKVVFLASRGPENRPRITPVGGLVFAKGRDGEIHVSTSDGYLAIRRVRIGSEEGAASELIPLGVRFRPVPTGGRGGR
ncbi:methionyl-tRNA formyltransferase [Candidatus Bipolaricaulota bacterium]|nr:methionyl-tRNA formyltransferase [Candidatus Bipolaricaulota bacterium]